MRALFQVLVFPYKPKGEEILFFICLRSDLGFWQPISVEEKIPRLALPRKNRLIVEGFGRVVP